MPRSPIGNLARVASAAILPSHKLRWTPEGRGFVAGWLVLLLMGIYQQINLVLLIAGLAAGPFVGSIFVSKAMLRGLRISRRAPPFVFADTSLAIDYVLENPRRWRDALALSAVDALIPIEPGTSEARAVYPDVFFPRVPGRSRASQTWREVAPSRGRYRFGTIELVTRSPFGLLERRLTIEDPGALLVYPSVGTLTRRWRRTFLEATETRRGRRHDRSAQQQEYHGLRDYRPGDSPRWIHWRTTARLGQPMVKEFEQQSEQDLAVLLDPWLPRNKADLDRREAVEQAIRFCASVCLETCKGQGRRLLLGWTGATPGVRHGPASIRLLHEALESLALLRPTSEGHLGGLFDVVPPPMLRDAMLLIVTTRPIVLAEELERSRRLSGATGFRMVGRSLLLDASRGDLDDYIRFDRASTRAPVRVDRFEDQDQDQDRPEPPQHNGRPDRSAELGRAVP